MAESKNDLVQRCGKLLFLFLFVAGLTAPAHAVLKAKWRSSTQNAKWAAEQQLPIVNYSAQGSQIDLDTSVKYQTIDGWGGSPNEVGMIALHTLPVALQDSVIKSLFDTVTGCKFNMIRLPIACSDFSNGTYSYDDLPGGITDDFNMARITIDRDKPGTIAFTKAAQKLNPNLKVWGSPWTAPPWMKNNNNWILGGANTDECAVKQTGQVLTAYALYFSKVVTLLKAEGLNYFALSFQNEPRVCQPFPSTRWSGGATMENFMKNYLSPRMKADHPDIELWTPTMNVADHTYFSPMLDDTSTHIAAACFQYEGRDAIAWVHATYPKLKLYATELVCGGGDNQWSFAFDPTFKDVKFYIDNGAGGAFQWNLILEKNGNSGPTVNFKQNCMITMDTVAKTITFQPQYYVLKHFSYYIRPGSRVIKATGSYAANQVSVKNPDGSIAVVAQNLSTGTQQVSVHFGSQMVTASMPGSSFGSFLIWDDQVGIRLPVAPSRSGPAIRTGSFTVAGDGFVLPAVFDGRMNECAVYDLQGRFLGQLTVKNRTISLSRDLGMASGVHIVRLRSILQP
jgi:glucosylceramidase